MGDEMPKSRSLVQKRKAEVIDLEIIGEKRVHKPFKPVVRNQTQKEEDSLLQVCVTVHPKLNGFPVALCERLQQACQASFYSHMFALQTGTMPKHHQTYCIITSTRIRSKSIEFQTTMAITNIVDLSTANATLLRYFLDNTNVDLSKRTFVESETVEGVANPEFLELYSVRRGDLGWGFDTDGCLSIYGAKAFDNKLTEKVWYAKSSVVKIEDEG
ncbi:hypothetical protein PtrSN002B_001121 [Pyrenophora tritici-repentis]|uniref:Uncharacterized protein n=2 Tax=Pyrenophora tritici-repentis TaxID=45151 RepID=A0A2W1G0S9_9PLEO|nr:uncharacterized protein PTRG_08756 [Pyrenophora tritici-repentis Pt-1C-BFP]KAA8627326.1 hypothetical protein PtrV1_03006 [Pyrenophora tritici-repentis]EDU41807.1 predicted protein [Pyrenophora tritici-repentis Pt-1C-BFP]KAF7442649.1 hypothetical protein A1F99_135180 [Pyrenophora tritici-repentis]KAF7578975.1 hypothetical protein PtrM4_032150 [Pyrenophora tritici-repentis]KAG9377909.1 hypothetical protein A1F94_011025 [Pyrenophora tritici-repentis]